MEIPTVEDLILTTREKLDLTYRKFREACWALEEAHYTAIFNDWDDLADMIRAAFGRYTWAVDDYLTEQERGIDDER